MATSGKTGFVATAMRRPPRPRPLHQEPGLHPGCREGAQRRKGLPVKAFEDRDPEISRSPRLPLKSLHKAFPYRAPGIRPADRLPHRDQESGEEGFRRIVRRHELLKAVEIGRHEAIHIVAQQRAVQVEQNRADHPG